LSRTQNGLSIEPANSNFRWANVRGPADGPHQARTAELLFAQNNGAVADC
jgi:hypothetical protein